MPKKPRKKSTSKKHTSRKAPPKVKAKKVTAKKKGAKKAAPKKAAYKKAVPRAAGAGKARTLGRLTEADLVRMKRRVQADPRVAGIFSFLNTYLQASEYQVCQMMARAGIWVGTPPKNPGGNGSAEFGTLDYDLNNPGSNVILQDLQKVWKYVVGSLPATQMSATNYANLQAAMAPGKPGLVSNDGTWFSQNTYGTGDLLWLEAAADYFYNYATGNFFAPFPVSVPTVTLKGASPSQVKIALFGDWGTGNYTNGPAASVMKAMVALRPDYLIHLGDVYYAGTTAEEKNNLLALWPAAYSGKSFTLNSNHEMYSGAFGYFGVLANQIFSLQNQTSFFALQYGNPNQAGGPWTIIGLDSGYWSTSPFVMDGSIQEATGTGSMAQPQFLQKLVQGGLSPRNAIVLTHHNPIDTFGASLVTDQLGNNLWAQVTAAGALNGTPSAWYWGHVHNGIVYPNPAYTKNNVYGRCVGHGALPFGNAWGMASVPSTQVQAYANTPNPKAPPLMMNGFVLLTITQSGQVTEIFYQQDGTQAPWVKPFTYQLGKAGAAVAGES